jgi:hypothetical protein
VVYPTKIGEEASQKMKLIVEHKSEISSKAAADAADAAATAWDVHTESRSGSEWNTG